MRPRPFETRSFPNSLAATLAVLPSMSLSQKLRSTSRFSHLCLARRSLGEGGSLASLRLHSLIARTRSLLCVDHSHGPCLRQLPSCVAVYPRDARSRRVLCRSSRSLHSTFLSLNSRWVSWKTKSGGESSFATSRGERRA